MTNPQIQNNLVPVNEPTLQDLLNLVKTEIGINTNCHHVGIIQSFDPATQTVKVSVAYSKTIFVADQDTGVYTAQTKNYPLLAQVPVVVMGGGAAGLSFPISAGDECLLMFNDRDINNWFQSGQIGPVATPRTHSFSDAFALVGVNSIGNFYPNYDATRATLFNGLVGVGVSPALIKIYNATTTLGTLMQQMIVQLETLANTPAVPASPINPAVATALTAIAVQLAGLLE